MSLELACLVITLPVILFVLVGLSAWTSARARRRKERWRGIDRS